MSDRRRPERGLAGAFGPARRRHDIEKNVCGPVVFAWNCGGQKPKRSVCDDLWGHGGLVWRKNCGFTF